MRPFGLKNMVLKTALGIGVAATLALSSYSLGATKSSTDAQDANRVVEINSSLISNASAKYSDGSVGSAKVSDSKGVPISTIIRKVRNTDPAGFAARLNTLESSPEFSRFLISQAGSVEAGGIQGLAATLTQKQINAFVASIKGKTFEIVTGKDGKQAVALTAKKPTEQPATHLASTPSSRPTITTAGWSGPSCWQGWFAMGGYSAATGAICGAVGAFSLGIGWVTCVGFGAFGAGINWNDACR